jgi:hypothetical protein
VSVEGDKDGDGSCGDADMGASPVVMVVGVRLWWWWSWWWLGLIQFGQNRMAANELSMPTPEVEVEECQELRSQGGGRATRGGMHNDPFTA